MRKLLSLFIWILAGLQASAETNMSKQTKENRDQPGIRTVYEYVEAINRADIHKLTGLMADNHLFIDAHDNRIEGKEGMRKSWIGYFEMFPDYKIEISRIIEQGNTYCILGYAGGTYKNLKNEQNSNYWRVPAAWTVIVENDRIQHWQVYADNYFAIQIINRNEKSTWQSGQ